MEESTPNQLLLDDLLSCDPWDAEAHESAKAAVDRWRFRPWKGRISGNLVWVEETSENGHYEPLAAQPAVASPAAMITDAPPRIEPLIASVEMTLAATGGCMTSEGINRAFEAYVDPCGRLCDLEAALYAFAPKGGRLTAAKGLMEGVKTDLDPEDIISAFTMEIIRRFRRGEYCNHDGRFDHWMAHVWTKWFFPEVKTLFYSHINLTFGVNEKDFDFAEWGSTKHVAGELLRVDVDREATQRDIERWNDPARLVTRLLLALDNPKSKWSKVSSGAKTMIRKMADGANGEDSANAAGVGARQGRRIFKKLAEQVEAESEMWDELFYSASDFGVSS